MQRKFWPTLYNIYRIISPLLKFQLFVQVPLLLHVVYPWLARKDWTMHAFTRMQIGYALAGLSLFCAVVSNTTNKNPFSFYVNNNDIFIRDSCVSMYSLIHDTCLYPTSLPPDKVFRPRDRSFIPADKLLNLVGIFQNLYLKISS